MPDPSATGNTAPANELHVDTPQGSVFVRQVPGEDPPVVLMHGFPDDQRIYNRLLPHLPPRRAVAFDFLGYGRSDRSDAAGFSLKNTDRKSPPCSTPSAYPPRSWPAPSLHLVNDAGHYPQHDQPEVVAELLKQPS